MTVSTQPTVDLSVAVPPARTVSEPRGHRRRVCKSADESARFQVDASQLERRICYSAAPADFEAEGETDGPISDSHESIDQFLEQAQLVDTPGHLDLDDSLRRADDPLAPMVAFGGEQAGQQIRRELVLIDSQVEGLQALVDDLMHATDSRREVDVAILNDDDPLSAIGETLQGYQGLDALHLISHGGQGPTQPGERVAG